MENSEIMHPNNHQHNIYATENRLESTEPNISKQCARARVAQLDKNREPRSSSAPIVRTRAVRAQTLAARICGPDGSELMLRLLRHCGCVLRRLRVMLDLSRPWTQLELLR
jgi:hypothetical protein